MADDLIPNQILTLLAIIGGLICIYASELTFVGGILAITAAVLATVYGTNTLRHVGKYSLGTGVPSIIYMLTAVSVVSYLLSISLSTEINQAVLFPVLSIIFAAIIAYVVSLICKYVFGIQVEILAKSFISISVAAVLLITAMSALIAQTFDPTVIYHNTIENGIVIILMIMSVMAIQNPYNSCMGPNEDQYRTLSLSLSNVFIMLIIASVISILTTQYWYVYLLISVIGWFFSFRKYIAYSKHQAASVKTYGLWPKDDGEN